MAPEEIELEVRKATPEDADTLFMWRNLPEVVSRTTSQRGVSREEHLAWYEAAMDDHDKLLLMLEVEGEGAGHARFDRRSEADCVISVYLTPSHAGRGLGPGAIRLACGTAFDAWTVDRITAYVRNDNPRAQKAFPRAGFSLLQGDRSCPPAHAAYELRRDG